MKHALTLVLLAMVLPATVHADVVRLDELPLDTIRQDWGEPHANKSVDANALSIGGKSFEHGVGTHAGSTWWIALDGHAQRLTASVGFDDEVKRDPQAKQTTLIFTVVGDAGTLWTSGDMHVNDATKLVDVDLTGQKKVGLIVMPAEQSGIGWAHADWAEAAITYAGAKPVPVKPPEEPRIILTPSPAATPRITGPSVFGVRPGHPILFTATATGDKPMKFEAENLPNGVSIDSGTGRLSGSIADAGTYPVTLHATNAKGTQTAVLKLVVGDKISLTPPMGWNSWNCFAADVSDEKIRSAADALVASGLADHGWSYINVDDCWQVSGKEPRDKRRAADGHVLTNSKFPDMKALADYVHSKGLKMGAYSSPGETTCGNFEGSYQHELDDAKQYAAWGFDYLKYDWCSYGSVYNQRIHEQGESKNVALHQEPYRLMHDELAKQPRDIVFSLCQYGDAEVWKWGAEIGGQLWRTTGDINDSWNSMSGIGFKQSDIAKYAGPGHWNDPDMLVVGKVGWGSNLHDTHLTPNEQYTHITLWSLLSAPLLIGCDLTQMDDFTKSLLTNDEVIAIDQDPLGEEAHRVTRDDKAQTEVWVKKLESGDVAIGLFNRGEMPTKVTIKWADIGLTGPQQARDLWRQKDVDTDADGYAVEIARHGTTLIKLSPKK